MIKKILVVDDQKRIVDLLSQLRVCGDDRDRWRECVKPCEAVPARLDHFRCDDAGYGRNGNVLKDKGG